MHYTNWTTRQLQVRLQPHHTNHTTLQLQLQLQIHSTTTTITTTTRTTTALHHTTSGVVVMWWGDHCEHCNHFQKTQLQLPFGPWVDSLCHLWFTTTNLSYTFPFFDTSATALCGTTGHKSQTKRNRTMLGFDCFSRERPSEGFF